METFKFNTVIAGFTVFIVLALDLKRKKKNYVFEIIFF